jgi:serine/threonine-protein kinase HipA
MTGAIEIYIDLSGTTHLVGCCRYVAKRRGQSSVFECADEWLNNPDAFALDPANLPLGGGQMYTTDELRLTIPDYSVSSMASLNPVDATQ